MTTRPFLRAGLARALPLLAGLAVAACGGRDPVSVVPAGSGSQTLAVRTGTEVWVTLQTVGPGEYASPPAVSSTAVAYLGVEYVGPSVPAGPTQRFRFRAVSRGEAVVVFRHTGANRTVEDTVRVR